MGVRFIFIYALPGEDTITEQTASNSPGVYNISTLTLGFSGVYSF